MTPYESLKQKCLLNGTLFEDDDFPASGSSLYFHSTRPSPLIWKRPKEIVPDAKFIVDGALYQDLAQGTLGNCWFLAALASLAANNKSLLEKIVPPDQSFDTEYAGIFRFNFWQYGSWREVVVDDRLPTRRGQLQYTSGTTSSEFWCALLEKAYAKLYGCYQAIEGGRVHDALLDMTSGITEIAELKKACSVDKLSNILAASFSMETIMGAAIYASGRREFRLTTGLYAGHAYSIIRHKMVTHKDQRKMLLLVRNPFGRGEWNGAWCDNDAAWSELCSSEREDQAFNKRDDGEFWISVEDFAKNFDALEACHMYPELLTSDKGSGLVERKKWRLTEFTGNWVKDKTAGGPPVDLTSSDLFWSNPQFRLTLDNSKPVSVVISLQEITNKLLRDGADVSIDFVIFKLASGSEVTGRLMGDNYSEQTAQKVTTSPAFTPYRELAQHFVLDPGTYIIVPCTAAPGKEAEFYLRIFSELPDDVLKESKVCVSR